MMLDTDVVFGERRIGVNEREVGPRSIAGSSAIVTCHRIR